MSGLLLVQPTHALRPVYIPPAGAVAAQVLYDGTMYSTLPTAALTLGPNMSCFSIVSHTASVGGVHLLTFNASNWWTKGYVGASATIQQLTCDLPSTAQTLAEGLPRALMLKLEGWVRAGPAITYQESGVAQALTYPVTWTASGVLHADTVGGPVGYGAVGVVSEIVCTSTAVTTVQQQAYTTATMTAYGL